MIACSGWLRPPIRPNCHCPPPRWAAWQADNPFFEQGLVDESYSRTLFCGRGMLLIAIAWRSGPWQQALGFFVSPPRRSAA
ncbi:hypothetical protein [Streptomyces sp. NPDC005525]|uniref:hypothetical protein n=1 Tax=Streptomyces sp. NPDC005525 TaxID=3364720 RepID=UPI00367899DC